MLAFIIIFYEQSDNDHFMFVMIPWRCNYRYLPYRLLWNRMEVPKFYTIQSRESNSKGGTWLPRYTALRTAILYCPSHISVRMHRLNGSRCKKQYHSPQFEGTFLGTDPNAVIAYGPGTWQALRILTKSCRNSFRDSVTIIISSVRLQHRNFDLHPRCYASNIYRS